MLNHVTDTGKSNSWRDVITSIVQTSNFVVLNNITMHRIKISDRQREASYGKEISIREAACLHFTNKVYIVQHRGMHFAIGICKIEIKHVHNT